MKISEYLTKDEQKILFFLLIMGFIGITLRLYITEDDNSTDMETLTEIISQPSSIHYDINTVTANELKTIPGIGEVRAAAIVEFREQNKPITVDDLIKIRGIGAKTVEVMKEYFYADND